MGHGVQRTRRTHQARTEIALVGGVLMLMMRMHRTAVVWMLCVDAAGFFVIQVVHGRGVAQATVNGARHCRSPCTPKREQAGQQYQQPEAKEFHSNWQ